MSSEFPCSAKKYNQEKKPTNLCALREFLKKCLPCLIIIQSCYCDYRIYKTFTCSRCELVFVLCSRDLDILRAQRIIGFILSYPQINEIGKDRNKRNLHLKLICLALKLRLEAEITHFKASFSLYCSFQFLCMC